ncbi:uncharacterized protein LOC127079180 [Lathyrus oleraceus]|uniref:uncharacterized protein LOC127079180 n=1 Tax=Pisum sativum TaxID=3888 RepID=UPI0021D10777|nr:uncharacterized protein LOC127079180 [Pisum sativum]
MTLNWVQSKNILATLKRKRPGNIVNIRKVYNIWYQNNKALRGDKTEIQQLLKLLDDNSYVPRYQTCEDEVTVKDIFWTHLDSIKLFNMFPNLPIIDSIYKTNQYRLPLLEIVESDKEKNVTWALEVCRTMLKDQEDMPKVIIIDRDTSLMKSVAKEGVPENPDLLKYVESTFLYQEIGDIVIDNNFKITELVNEFVNHNYNNFLDFKLSENLKLTFLFLSFGLQYSDNYLNLSGDSISH